MALGKALLMAVGDVAPCRAAPKTMFDGVRSTLAQADVLFGQLESTVTTRGSRAPNARLAMRTGHEDAAAIAGAGFDVMSFAGNHCLDWGEEGFADTLYTMNRLGVRLCGAGPTLTEALAPAAVTVRRRSVAFLAWSSILPEGYWADAHSPGCAPMRAHTGFEMVEPDQPGTPPRVWTTPHTGDLQELTNAIQTAKDAHDIVVASFHWGIHMTPFVIADYQSTVAHAAIDAGADLVLGHHPHILKGVEVYKGKAILYSMGNFAIEMPQAFDPRITDSASFRHLMSLNPGAPVNALYVLPENTRYSVIVEAELDYDRVSAVALRPVWIADDASPHTLGSHDPRFGVVADFVVQSCREAGLHTNITREGGRLHITLDG